MFVAKGFRGETWHGWLMQGFCLDEDESFR